MIVWAIINMLLAFILKPIVVKEEDKCLFTTLLYYICCLDLTFVGGIIVYKLFKRIVEGR